MGSSRGRPLCIKEAEWASTQSAGGFSYYFKRPGYQKAHVARYLHKMRKRSKLPVTRKYNWMYGRAYPDVSAFGEDLLCNMHGRLQRGDGTSTSTPLVAGVFAQQFPSPYMPTSCVTGIQVQASMPPVAVCGAHSNAALVVI